MLSFIFTQEIKFLFPTVIAFIKTCSIFANIPSRPQGTHVIPFMLIALLGGCLIKFKAASLHMMSPATKTDCISCWHYQRAMKLAIFQLKLLHLICHNSYWMNKCIRKWQDS